MDIWRPVRGALRSILLATPGVPTGSIAYEGMGFRDAQNKPVPPPSNLPWINESIVKGLAAPRPYRVTENSGIYSIDLNWPRVGSFAEGEDLADAIRTAFHPAREIATAGEGYQFGAVVSSMTRTAIMFDNWTQFPIRVEFYFRHRF